MIAKESVKRNAAIWLSDLHAITDGSLLLGKVDNTYIEGVVALSPEQMTVTMIVPFPDKTKSVMLEMSTGISFVELESEGGYTASEYGRLRAQELLLDIFFACQ